MNSFINSFVGARWSALFPLSLLVTVASAQRVYVIDGLNRAGTNFTDLPAAEVAAQHGDIFDVRADGGAYTAITTSKALTILGNSAAIRVTRGQPFRVSGLPAGREFVLQRCSMFINQLPPAPMVELVQCAGRVHLQQVDLSNYSGYSNQGLPKGATIGIQIASVGALGVELSNPAFATVP